MSSVAVSCTDKLFGKFNDVKRKIDETNDHILLLDNLDVMLDVEMFCRSYLSNVFDDCSCGLSSSSSTRRTGTRFFDTFGVKI